MIWTDDPVADFERYDAILQEQLKQMPHCINCGEPIQDDHLFNIDGDLFCEECMVENFRRSTEDYVERL